MPLKIHRVGAELPSVRRFLAGATDAFALASALQGLTSAVAIRGEVDASDSVDGNSRFIAEIALGLICRGWPTASSPAIERHLLDGLLAEPGLQVLRGPDYELMWELSASDEHAGAWDKALSEALLPVDQRLQLWDLENLLKEDSEAEARFHKQALGSLLGAAVGLVERQRPLERMVDDPKEASKVVHQRADFTIELPAIAGKSDEVRLNLEVDGPHHREPEQIVIDRRRDGVLRRSGWRVARIPVEGMQCAEVAARSELSSVFDHPIIQACRDCDPTSENRQLNHAARRLLITPHAVARMQLAVLLALRDGRITLDQESWVILAREREVAAAHAAMLDLIEMLDRLCKLYSIPFGAIVELDIEAASNAGPHGEPIQWPAELLERVHTMQWRPGERNPHEYDLAIDISVLARPTQWYGDERNDDGWVRLRTAHRHAGAERATWSAPRCIDAPLDREPELTYFLQYAFRKRAFRDGQLEIIERALQRKSAIGLLPTGAGKSLTYQLPALLTPGFTFVVDPIKSLMQDQVDNLEDAGIDSAVAVNSDLAPAEKDAAERAMASGTYRFTFVSPERFQIEQFRKRVTAMCYEWPVAFAVIDEAHCVSEWGHDFRTAYLNLGRHINELLSHDGHPPPILALTGTASRPVLTDVQREIGVQDPAAVIEPQSFDRPELNFHIIRTESSGKMAALKSFLGNGSVELSQRGYECSDEDLTSGQIGGIVFCPHVKNVFGVYEVSQNVMLQNKWADTVGYYSGAAPEALKISNHEWNTLKAKTQRDFKSNKLSLLVATSAFGMGIDKPNIRYTVHYGAPKSIEALVQEAGRAGRDRQPAICTVIFSDHIPTNKADPMQRGISVEEASMRLKAIPREAQDDACRSLYLHSTGYHGAEREALDIQLFYQVRIRPYWDALRATSRPSALIDDDWKVKNLLRDKAVERRQQALAAKIQDSTNQFDEGDPLTNPGIATSFDRIVYRLSLLGVITDYTVNYRAYGGDQFQLVTAPISEERVLFNLYQYIRRYRREDILPEIRAVYDAAEGDEVERAIKALCVFVYHEIESRRREAIWNVRQALRDATDGVHLKQLLANYFDTSIFRPLVFDLLAGDKTVDDWWKITAEVRSPTEAAQLLGQCRRALESDPDHAGLRILSGLARAMVEPPDPREAAESLLLGFAREYAAHPERVDSTVERTVDELRVLGPRHFDEVVAATMHQAESGADSVERSAEDMAISALPHLEVPSARQVSAQAIARRISREVSESANQASASIEAMLDRWNAVSPERLDRSVEDVLGAMQNARGNFRTARTVLQSAAHSRVADPKLKRRCAVPILEGMKRAVQRVL